MFENCLNVWCLWVLKEGIKFFVTGVICSCIVLCGCLDLKYSFKVKIKCVGFI